MSLPEYDENEAITFMRRELPEEANKRYSDDDLVDILDAIWDYYDSVEATSLNDIPDDDDEDPRLQADAIAGGIFRILSKHGPEAINLPDLTLIVKGELAYEEDLGNRM